MLHCLNMAGNVVGVTGMDMSVLERQRMVLKWQDEQLIQQQKSQQEQDQSYFNELSLVAFLPAQAQNFQDLNVNFGPGPTLTQLFNRPIKVDPGVEYRWMDSQMPQSRVTVDSTGIDSIGHISSPGCGLNYAMPGLPSCQPLAAASEAKTVECLTSYKKLSGAVGRESFKKRKAEKNLPSKVDAEEDRKPKKRKGHTEEEESKITEQNSNSSESNHNETTGNNNSGKKRKEISGCTSKDNSIQKPDYIHVRARRGQATDSHSLAERVRREKISERMKYLEELVPGCNKITGKAGMLDEIINYVQSLQRQVEFLSMKLAAVNPRLDFNIEDLIAKEVFAGCSTSLPTMGTLASMTNANYMHYNSVQQLDSVCASEVALNPIDMGLCRTISTPVSLPEAFIDPPCFNQIPNWDADLQNIYTVEFQQGRSMPFSLQTLTGATIEGSSLKMKMLPR